MNKSLRDIAVDLKDSTNKVQLIYAFNGIGKTRLSQEFKELIDSNGGEEENAKIIYYNAFTEDLFYWDNDLAEDKERKLLIHPNGFTNWVLKVQGQENNIVSIFQHYTSNKLTPHFNEEYSEVTFSIDGGNDESTSNIKISKGEESCLIWCVFYSLLEEVVEELNKPEERSTDQFDQLEYVFIDDPVSSLDENHLIELAVNIAELIRSSESNLKFIITTHNPLFYNVLYNELGAKAGYMLMKNEDGTFVLDSKRGDSNKSFSYHLFLKQTLQEAIETNSIQRYHFTLLRNLYEKTANFLGYPKWSALLPEEQKLYYNRIIQFSSHSTLSNEVVAQPTDPEKSTLKFLFEHLIENKYWKE